MDCSEVGGPAEEQDAEGDEMQSSPSGGQALVVTSQSAETGHPSTGAFDDPSAWQQDEAALDHG